MPATVVTPLGEHEGVTLAQKVCVIPILRAGLGMVEPMLDLLPNADVHHIGMYRSRNSLLPIQVRSSQGWVHQNREGKWEVRRRDRSRRRSNRQRAARQRAAGRLSRAHARAGDGGVPSLSRARTHARVAPGRSHAERAAAARRDLAQRDDDDRARSPTRRRPRRAR